MINEENKTEPLFVPTVMHTAINRIGVKVNVWRFIDIHW